MSIYRKRWQWWMPWSTARWWRPRWWRGGDEWCNDSIAVVIPPFGCFVIFWRPGTLRTMPCPACWQHLPESTRADYMPCGYLYNGNIRKRAHVHEEPCAESLRYLAVALPVPTRGRHYSL